MEPDYFGILKQDVRLKEGLNACINCGICTAVCPAAEYFEYDPRSIVVTVQSGDREKIAALLEGDTIWYCGQCMSCKTRCPRDNCPGMIINVLRKLSQETGAFIKSRMGRQQYLVIKSVGANILHYGYCMHPATVIPETHPEQGPVWEWIFDRRSEVYESVGANLDGKGSGAMRKISPRDLYEIKSIFEQSGGMELFATVERYSRAKAVEMGFTGEDGEADMDRYTQFLLNENNERP
jgi:heterodisulfide reductase subunit C